MAFVYRPLAGPESIRLLLLEPSAADDAELRGHLLETTIHDAAADIYTGYIAVSYVWGDQSMRTTITIDDHYLSITASLGAVLRDIRHSSIPCRVWADGVCIDQHNIPERNEQVRLMGGIYETAVHTIIYLGSLTPAAELVLLSAAPQQRTSSIKSGVALAEDDILTRSWFTRAWVLQELVMSKDPWVQCGRVRVQWRSLCALLLPDEAGDAASVQSPGRRRLKNMNDARHQRQTTLLDLLHAHRDSVATDPRDLVFALVGMVRKLEPWIKEMVEYSLSVERIYAMLALGVFQHGSRNDANLLLSLIDENIPLDERRCPSWAPDWRNTVTNHLRQCHTYSDLPRQGTAELASEWYAVIEDDPPILVTAVRFFKGVLEVAGPVFPPPSSIDANLRKRCADTLLVNWRRYYLLCSIFSKDWQEFWEIILAGEKYPGFFPQDASFIAYLHENIVEELASYLNGKPNTVEGRRMAFVPTRDREADCQVTLVPSSARSGDIAVEFSSTYDKYLFRQEPLSPKLAGSGPFSIFEHDRLGPARKIIKLDGCGRLVGRLQTTWSDYLYEAGVTTIAIL